MKNKKITGEFYLFCFVIFVFMILAIFASDFYTVNNLMSILNTFSYTIIGAIGMNLIMITGNIDISAGSIISVAAICCAGLGYLSLPFPILLAGCMIVGMILCSINGSATIRLGVPSMVVTLATSQVFSGILPFFNEATLYNLPPSFNWFAYKAKVFGIFPASFLLALIVMGIFLYIMKYTTYSKKLYAIGNDIHGAILTGIPVNKYIVITYMIAGLLFGISSFIIATASARVTNVMGSGMEFTLISAVILGGTNPAGGSGKLTGTILGALIMSIIASAIQFLGLGTDYQDMIKGIIILVTVVTVSMKDMKKKRNIAKEKEEVLVQ